MTAFIQAHFLEVLLGISFLLSFFSWGKRILFPFQIFTTWVHESWHAIMAVLMGGSGIRITLEPDGSGLTHYSIPKSRFRQGMVASAGYLGATATGCLIFFLNIQNFIPRLRFHTHSILYTLCGIIAFTLLFWVRNVFGWISVALMAVAIWGLTQPMCAPYAKGALAFLGVQTALNALFDLRVLFSVKDSDAHTLQKLFYLPFWFWAILWLGVSGYLMYWTAKLTLGFTWV